MPSDNEILKMRSGGSITAAEAERLLSMPHKERYAKLKEHKPAKIKDPIPKSKHKLKRVTGAAATKKEVDKQRSYAQNMRMKKKSSASTVGGGGVGGGAG